MSDRLTDADLEVLMTVGDEVAALAREVQASRNLIGDLRALHVPITRTNHGGMNDPEYRCSCGHVAPCPTIRMIDEAGL